MSVFVVAFMALSAFGAMAAPDSDAVNQNNRWQFREGESSGFTKQLTMAQLEEMVSANMEKAELDKLLKKTTMNQVLAATILYTVFDYDFEDKEVLKMLKTDGYLAISALVKTVSVTDEEVKLKITVKAAINATAQAKLEGKFPDAGEFDELEDFFDTDEGNTVKNIDLAIGMFAKISAVADITLDAETYAIKSMDVDMNFNINADYKGNLDIKRSKSGFDYNIAYRNAESSSKLNIGFEATITASGGGINLFNGFEAGDWTTESGVEISNAKISISVTGLKGFTFGSIGGPLSMILKVFGDSESKPPLNEDSFETVINNLPIPPKMNMVFIGENELAESGDLNIRCGVFFAEDIPIEGIAGTIDKRAKYDNPLDPRIFFEPLDFDDEDDEDTESGLEPLMEIKLVLAAGSKIPMPILGSGKNQAFMNDIADSIVSDFKPLSGNETAGIDSNMGSIEEAKPADPTNSPASPLTASGSGGDMTLIIVIAAIAIIGAAGAAFYFLKIRKPAA